MAIIIYKYKTTFKIDNAGNKSDEIGKDFFGIFHFLQ